MIYLDTTTRKLQAVLGGAVAANQPKVSVFFYDVLPQSGSAVRRGAPQISTLNSTTDVDICAAPILQGIIRNIHTIFVYNRDTSAVTVTIKIDDSGTETELVKQTLSSGSSLIYEDQRGWQGIDPITLPVADTTELVKGSVDDTKRLRFEADGISTGTTRVITMPDSDVNLSGLTGTQTANRVFAGPASGAVAVPTFRALVTADMPGITEIVAPTSLPAANSVTISNIPQTYAALVLVVNGASSDTATRHILVQPNADTTASNYSGHVGQTGTYATTSEATIGGPGDQTAAQTMSGTFVITGYQAGPWTNGQSGGDYAAGAGFSSQVTHRSTSAVTSLQIIWSDTGNFDAGTYSLYGVN